MMETVNNGARGKEQQRLEKGMRHEVKNACGPGADAQPQKHVADLADRRPGEDALDVILIECGKRCQQQGGQTDQRYRHQRRRSQQEQLVGAGDQVDTRGHHGRRVNQRADRCRARHGVRQPGVQRELGGFAHGAAEQQRGGEYRHAVPGFPSGRRGGT